MTDTDVAPSRCVFIPPARKKAVVEILMLSGLGYLFLNHGRFSDWQRIAVLILPALLMVKTLAQLFHRGPVFVLSPDGLEDRSLAGVGKVAWQDIEQFEVVKSFLGPVLKAHLADSRSFWNEPGFGRRWRARLFVGRPDSVRLNSSWAKNAYEAAAYLDDYAHRAFSEPESSEMPIHFEPPQAPALTLNNDYVASNPSRCWVNPFQWFLARPQWPLIFALVLVALAAAYLAKVSLTEYWNLIPVAALVYWVRVFNHFQVGDCNPGLVLSLRPLTLAVATDLSTGGRPVPALKIVKFRLCLLHPDTFYVGQIIPTTSLYSASFRRGRNGNFFPLPLVFGTRDEAKLQAALATFPEEQIQDLHTAMAEIPKAKPGLHILA